MAFGPSDIDFGKIRAVRGDQKHGFEELVCQLGRLDRPDADAKYFRGDGAGGDGGVEAYWTLGDGGKIAYQAKYHLKSGDVDWGKIDGSVRTAMGVHPTIRRYVIAIACNLTPATARGKDRKGKKGRPQKSGIEHWDENLAQWAIDFPDVKFVRWDESELLGKLTHPEPEIVGIRAWFFVLPHWTAEWFRQRFEIAAQDLGDRYHADEHVEVGAAEAFEGLARTQLLMSGLGEALEMVRALFSDGLNVMELSDPLPKRATFREIVKVPAFEAAVDAVFGLRGLEKNFPPVIGDKVPLEEWTALAERAAKLIDALVAECGYSDAMRQIVAALRDAVAPVAELLRSDLFQAEQRRAVLLVGPAGGGKSHLLAEVADRATREGRVALLVPGQVLNASADPWHQIRARLDAERFSTEQFLGALDAAAEAANVRALILIDALNESADAGRWRDHLGGFVATILSYPCLAVAVSCRSDYLDWVVPEALRENFVVVDCPGFVSEEEQEQAAQIFLDRKGIARPAVPWLAPDFTNPLFLRVTTDGLKAAEENRYPQFVGLADFFGFFLSSLVGRYPFDQWQDTGLLPRCLLALAREMLRGGRQWISRASAQRALADVDGVADSRHAVDLLNDLKRGALLPLPDPQASRPASSLTPVPDGFIFVFQRLGDLLMAETLVDHIKAGSFEEGGELDLVSRNPHAWEGLLSALSILLPQRRRMELPDLADLQRDRWTAQRQFRDSLLWRTADAFLPATERWFDRLHKDYQLEVLIRLAPVPDHPWNADRLDRHLRAVTMPDRDVLWSIPLANAAFSAKEAIDQILIWALGTGCRPASDETLRLTATVLAWMLTTSARPIRDRATKALAHVFLLRPSVMARILSHFHDVDDPYVVERLWAAAYGAAMNAAADWPLGALAQQTWALCFADGRPPVSLRCRDHALGIIELAAAQDVLAPGIEISRCTPPFTTDWPLEEVEKEFVEGQRNPQGAWSAASSLTHGDFSRYTTRSCLERWSDAPLTAPSPRTGQQRYDKFVAGVVNSESPEVRAAWADFQRAEDNWGNLLIEILSEVKSGAVQERIAVVKESGRLDRNDALSALLALLPSDTAAEAKECIHGKTQRIPTYGQKRLERWLVKRVVNLGWTAGRFAGFDANLLNHGGDRPEIERIGKKYQWITLDEALARLSDNVHFIAQWPERVAPYGNTTDQPFFRDCDPSVLLANPPKGEADGKAWWLLPAVTLPAISPEAMFSWIKSDADVINAPDLFDIRGPDQRPWLLLYGMAKRADGSSTQFRESWSRVTTVMMRKADRDKVLDALQGHHISDPSGHLPPEFTDAGYLGEFAWRRTWPPEAYGTERDSMEPFRGLPVVWPVIGYHWEGHIDLSMGSVAIHLPSGWLCEHMGLSVQPGGSGNCVGSDGIVLFMDPAAFTPHSSVALIDRQRFLAFLDNSEWDCLWLIGGEKNLWPDRMSKPERWACQNHGGIYWWEGSAWHSRTWQDFNSSGV